MTMKLASLALGLTLLSPAAFALTADEVIADLQSQGYSHIEIRVGATRIKAEALRNGEKLETVYDLVSGAVLKRETAPLAAGASRSDAHGHAAGKAHSRRDDAGSAEDHVSGQHQQADDGADDNGSAQAENEAHDSQGHESGEHDSGEHESGEHESGDDH
jgi:hypothetical protein